MKLNKEQVEALKTLLNYVSYEEFEDYGGGENHIWMSIKPLYKLVYGEKDLNELENSFE